MRATISSRALAVVFGLVGMALGWAAPAPALDVMQVLVRMRARQRSGRTCVPRKFRDR